MTICISLLCENRKKAVVAMDRMLTSTSLSLEFEQKRCKITGITPNCIIAGAGNALSPTEIIRDAQFRISRLISPSVREIADSIKQSFVERREQKVVDNILRPRGFENIDNFYQRIRELPPDIYMVLDDQIARFHVLNQDITQLLVVGCDTDGSHIYTVYDPGVSECFDGIGFNAVGSGEPHAISTITTYDYTSEFALDQAIWIAYEAKRKGEKAPGVGKDIDICILDPQKGITFIEETFLKVLSDKFEEKNKSDKAFLQTIPNYSNKIKNDGG